MAASIERNRFSRINWVGIPCLLPKHDVYERLHLHKNRKHDDEDPTRRLKAAQDLRHALHVITGIAVFA
jgi:hypothetical protein